MNWNTKGIRKDVLQILLDTAPSHPDKELVMGDPHIAVGMSRLNIGSGVEALENIQKTASVLGKIFTDLRSDGQEFVFYLDSDTAITILHFWRLLDMHIKELDWLDNMVNHLMVFRQGQEEESDATAH
jgi:hypothetical protein